MINESIAKLVKYGENAGLVSGLDKIYATNRILEVMQISDYEEPEQIPETPDLEETLNELLDDAAKRGLLEHNSVVYRDLFDTKLMDCLMPRPGEMCIRDRFINLLLPGEEEPVIWRGPVIAGTVKQFWTDVIWGDLDYLLSLIHI